MMERRLEVLIPIL